MITLQVPSSITDADDIVTNISQWVQTEPSVDVNGVILDVDSGCPTMLDSSDADDCTVQTNPPSSSSSSSPPYGIIIGAGVAVVVIILLLIIVIVIIVVYRWHKSTYKYVSYIQHCLC